MVGQRMDEHGGVLAHLDNLVEVAKRATPHRLGQRSVNPYRLVSLDEVAADEVAAGQVLVAGDGDEFGGAMGRPRRWAMCSTKRVLPQPVGPFSSTGRRAL